MPLRSLAVGYCLLFCSITTVLADDSGADDGGVGDSKTDKLVDFPVRWADAEKSAIQFADTLSKPAGKHGPVRVKDAHLATGDGNRIRFWGTNFCGPSCFPEKANASLLADDLARMGINVVRFHHLDSDWGVSIFDRSRDDTLELDPQSLDNLDFFINELRLRGIYANLNLNVLRQYKKRDGVRDFDKLGAGKAATYFNPRLIELQQRFARQLLTHVNPYTGHSYAKEPCVAVVEIVNENSLIEAWVGWRLKGNDAWQGDPTWRPIPVSYDVELTGLFNAWLAETYSPDQVAAKRKDAGVGDGESIPRIAHDQFYTVSRERFEDNAKFLTELERRFFTRMKAFLKDELGVTALLVGDADHNDWICGYPHMQNNSMFDVMDGHGYWQHPSIGAETKITNTPMVNDPLDSTVVQFARTPVEGKPFTITETNHPFPHEYSAEGHLILTAYALLHDWDGIYWFDWGPGRLADFKVGQPPYGWFSVSTDPTKVATLAASYAMWQRRDVAASSKTIVRSVGKDEFYFNIKLDSRVERPYFQPGVSLHTPLKHATRYRFANDAIVPESEADSLAEIGSDTGELLWRNADQKRGVVTIDTARTQAVIGFKQDSPPQLKNVAVDLESDFATVVLTSLDGQPIADSKRLLLCACGKMANTEQAWKDDHQTLANWGHGPTRIESIRGNVTLSGLGAGKLSVHPLDGAGVPTQTKPIAVDAASATIPLNANTVWYAIER